MSILRGVLLNISTGIERFMPAQPCVLCGSMSRDGLWCMACDRALPHLGKQCCPSCALPVPSGEVCGSCLAQPPSFDLVTAAFVYNYPADRLIKAMKYGEQLALAHAFAEKLVQRIDRANLPDYILPMPLHPTKLRNRGFNQSLLIAARIARKLDLELLPNACQRIRDTPSQSALPWKERSRNVRNAFRCDMDMTGKRVALVDDVLTTGASLNALAEVVKKRGASEVYAWVAARTLPHSESRGKG